MISPSPPPASSKFAEVLEAHVVGFCKRTHTKRKKQYAVYNIDVSLAAAQWSIQRRFSDFVKFSSNLKSTFPTLRFLSLPSRLHKSLDPSFLEKRRQKLNSFIIDVLDQTPLVVPILKCDIIMQFLEVMKNLEKNFALDKRTKGREFFPDLYASFPFNKKTIHLTLQHGMDKGEEIPIHISAKEGNCEEVSALVRAHPQSMSTTDLLGQTALHVSSRHGQAPVIRLLLVLGANRNIQDKRGWSPLHCACTSADLQSVLTLLEDEAVIPDLQNVDGNTPLHYFVRNFSSSPPEMLKDILSIFTKKGSDVNAQNKSGETPLHHACWRGSFPLVATLLASGTDPNLLTVTEESALQWAIREGKTNIAHFLIQNGAKTDKSLFALPPQPVLEVVERPVDDVADDVADDEDFEDDDCSDDIDSEAIEKSKNGKFTSTHSESDTSSTASPSASYSSTYSISPSNFSSSNISSNFSLSNGSSFNSSPSNLSSSSSNISPSNITPPSTSPPLSDPPKFVIGTHSRNHAPSIFFPVLASPKRLLLPPEQEIHQHQLQQQLLQQLSPQSPQPEQPLEPPHPTPPSDTSSNETPLLVPTATEPSPQTSSNGFTADHDHSEPVTKPHDDDHYDHDSPVSPPSPSPVPRRPRSSAAGIPPPSPHSLLSHPPDLPADAQPLHLDVAEGSTK